MPDRIIFSKKCMFCDKEHYFIVNADAYHRWRSGEYIQEVWPEKSADEREMMISGTCSPECWDDCWEDEE